MMNISLRFLILLSLLIILSQSQNACHYTCQQCISNQYYQCLKCRQNRGRPDSSLLPFSGMCYCLNNYDEDINGQCILSDSYNYNNKLSIYLLIIFGLILSFLMLILHNNRYFFIKTIQDIQQLSIIILINLYFPQQFDIFLSYLYGFNISSYTFQTLANGTLFNIDQNNGVVVNDGTNIYGKYKLLYKTANFFSNQFTWMIVVISIGLMVVIVKYVKNKLNNNQNNINKQQKRQRLANQSYIKQSSSQANQYIEQQNKSQIIQTIKITTITTSRDYSIISLNNILIKLDNIFCYNFMITFFYLSLFQLNINIITQITNLTFSSSFSANGAFFSAIFLALQLILLSLLFLKTKEQVIKPQWMRDTGYSSTYYYIRTNYKTITKYFFYISCCKKILFAITIVLCYHSPQTSILFISIIQLLHLSISFYSQPYIKKYIRIHYYICQTIKLFFYISLINFVQKYKQFAKLIEITKVLFMMINFIFAVNLIVIIITLIVQWKVYYYEIKKIIHRSKQMIRNIQQYNKKKNNNNKNNNNKQQINNKNNKNNKNIRQQTQSQIIQPQQNKQQQQLTQQKEYIGYFHFISVDQNKTLSQIHSQNNNNNIKQQQFLNMNISNSNSNKTNNNINNDKSVKFNKFNKELQLEDKDNINLEEVKIKRQKKSQQKSQQQQENQINKQDKQGYIYIYHDYLNYIKK